MKRKAISLLSGGLDSVLATKIVLSQGIEVVGLHFTSPFSSKREKERGLQAVRSSEELGIKLIIKEKESDYIDIIKKPRYGYGKNMNPCIDCRIYMLKKTKDIMEEEDAGFVITGEVLGQRPMSQRRDTINIIERESGLAGLILRPLSAMLFPPSMPEKEGIVDRSRLFDITGRSRAIQYELASKFKLSEFGCPGGGCLLTDPIFSRKLKDLFQHDTSFTMDDIVLLSIGRHFRLNEKIKVIVGRNKAENDMLCSLDKDAYSLVLPLGFTGPMALIKGNPDESDLDIIGNIIAYFSKYPNDTIDIEIRDKKTRVFTAKKRLLDLDMIKI
ncbi:MAG: hypothetical protein N3D15_07260 [Syntrophorhabdaceae bacterium]|nr:hypothetical protein [Syntrophorhabdaceae bacterium]